MRPLGAGLVAAIGLCVVCYGDLLVLTGKVMDETGKPVAEAEVWVRDAKTGKTTTTRSAAGGSFRLEFEAGRQREWEVMAVAPGLALGQARYSRDDPKPVAVRLAAEAALRGRVLDSDGKPVVGAEVTAFALTPAERDPARPWDFVFVTPEAASGP